MVRPILPIAGLCLVIAFAALTLAPSARAVTEIPIDITKEINGYTIHVVGLITIDEEARTVSGWLRVTVTDPNGDVVYDREFRFSFSWSTPPQPYTFFVPGAGVRVFLYLGGSGASVSAMETMTVRFPATLRPAQLDRLK